MTRIDPLVLSTLALASPARARRAGKRWYHDNRFEAEARNEARLAGRPD